MSKAVMQQALDALEMMRDKYSEYACPACDHADAAIKALRQDLAEPEQEPCAMRYAFDGYGYAYIDSGSGSNWQTRHKDAEPLYTRPYDQTSLELCGVCGWRTMVPGDACLNCERAKPEQERPHPDYPCRSDGRCQYAIDSGAEGLGHCPPGKCCTVARLEPTAQEIQNAAENLALMKRMFPQPEQEPVAWISEDENLLSLEKFYDDMKPLYAHPPTPRRPLTYDELEPLCEAFDSYDTTQNELVEFARAIERAHGITGEQT